MNSPSLLQSHEITFFRIRDYIHSYGKLEGKQDKQVWTLGSLTLVHFYRAGQELLVSGDVEFLYNQQNFNYEFKRGNIVSLTKLFIDIKQRKVVRELLHVNSNK